MSAVAQNSAQGYVISDLHLLATRSTAAAVYDEMVAKAQGAEYFVLNGDIFDFKWAGERDFQAAYAQADAWLDALCAAAPTCQFHYILGNHDGYATFYQYLLDKRPANLHVHLTHWRRGEALFLHGDLPLYGLNPFERELITREHSKGPLMDRLYTALVKTRVHRAIYLIHTPAYTTRRILRAFHEHPHQDLEGIRHIYIGHSHACFENYQAGGYIFHNTGGQIEGLRGEIYGVEA